MKNSKSPSRRSFIGNSLAFCSALAFSGLSFKPTENSEKTVEGLFMVGPREGYSPLIGTMVSMLENMSHQVKTTVQDLSMEQLDFQLDDKSNTIGALIMHLVSSEKFHQAGTFEERPLNEEELKFWAPARRLADPLSKSIKGHEIDYYLEVMDQVRKDTLEGFRQRDDAWLLSKDPFFSTEERPLNKFWRWFHCCEHMSNHNGQIKLVMARFPEY